MTYKRRETYQVDVSGIKIGGGAPIVIQSMTDTPTTEVDKTVSQIIELADAGSEIVRIAVHTLSEAESVPKIKEEISRLGYGHVPIVGCFHYNGHTLLRSVPDCAKYLDKYRLNPGNVGLGTKRDKNFEEIIETAIKYNKPIRIGANWGSLDQELLAEFMDKYSDVSSDIIMCNALIQSTLSSAKKAESIGLSKDKIVISAKVSEVQHLISVYTTLADQSEYAMHLGLTEAGSGIKGIVSSTAAIATLLQQGIGDTIRVSITPKPNNSRCEEVKVCREILQSMGLRSFKPIVISCPGCGRTSQNEHLMLVEEVNNLIEKSYNDWIKQYSGVENLKIAVMGCIVNGPGESKHADIGISFPGRNEKHLGARVFVNSKQKCVLRGPSLIDDFKSIIEEYIKENYSKIIGNK